MQWLCNANKKSDIPAKRLFCFFSSLYSVLVSIRSPHVGWLPVPSLPCRQGDKVEESHGKGLVRWDCMGRQDLIVILSLSRKFSGLALPNEMQKMLMSKSEPEYHSCVHCAEF